MLETKDMKNTATDVRLVKRRVGIQGSRQNFEASNIAVAIQPIPPIVIGKVVRQLDHGCELPAGMIPSMVAHAKPQNKCSQSNRFVISSLPN